MGGMRAGPHPAKGTVYVVNAVEVWRGIEALVLEGFPHKVGYESSHFRPIVDTDISVFTAMLEPEPNKPVRKRTTVGG
jgi:hypothetical protein